MGRVGEFVAERLGFDPGGEDAFATFQLHLLGAVAQLERSLIRQRQGEGIALARERGVTAGGTALWTPRRWPRRDAWWRRG